MTPLRRRMIEDLTLRNRAPLTIEKYIESVAEVARYFHASPERLGPEHVRSYLLHLVQERQVSGCSRVPAPVPSRWDSQPLEFLDKATGSHRREGSSTRPRCPT